jgi:hypothetical protein
MVIKGGARGGPVGLAAHLERTDENERVTLIGIHGVAARDVESALIEMDALGAGLKTSRTLYHVSINVGYGDRMSEERWQIAGAALREKLDLGGQPYIEIEHEKKGRTHRHFVISRTDIEHNRAVRADHNYRKHEEVARDLERQFGHERVQGAHVERDGKNRPERTPSYAEMQQAKRTGMTPQEATEFVTGLWQTTDSGKAFNAALEANGWMLARGDKRDFVLLDPHGETHSLARRVEGAKAKDVRARIADLDPASLPNVQEAKAQQQARQAERENQLQPGNAIDLAAERAMQEARAAAKGRYDRLNETHRDVAREAEPLPDIVRAFESNASRTTEPAAPGLTRMYRGIGDNVGPAQPGDALFFVNRPFASSDLRTSPLCRCYSRRNGEVREQRSTDQPQRLENRRPGDNCSPQTIRGRAKKRNTAGRAGAVRRRAAARGGGYAPARQSGGRNPHGMDAQPHRRRTGRGACGMRYRPCRSERRGSATKSAHGGIRQGSWQFRARAA